MSLRRYVRCRKNPPTQETPSKRYCFTFETLDSGEIILFGGGNFTNCVYNDVYLLDPELLEWKKIETTGPAPRPRRSQASCVCYNPVTGSQLLAVFGGCNYSWNPVHDPNVYFLDTKTWRWIVSECDSESKNHFTDFDLEMAYSNTLLFFDEPPRLYLYGGLHGVHQCNLSFNSKDGITCSWKSIDVSGKLVSNQYHASVAVGDRILIFGGRYNPNFHVYSFDTRKQTMSEIIPSGSTPEYRSFLSARLLTDNLVVIFGGSEMEIKDDMFLYNISDQRFVPVIMDPLPRTVFGHSAAIWKYRMLTFGGTYDSSGTEGCNADLWVFDGFATLVAPMQKDIGDMFDQHLIGS